MSFGDKMTAIADKIRILLGITGTMGLDAMATNLGMEQTNVTNAFTAIGNKGGTVPSSKVSGNLVSAIDSIPLGVTVQKKSGTFTTNYSGTATVNCGFKPDLVAINGGSDSYSSYFIAVPFTEGNTTKGTLTIIPPNSNYVFTMVLVTQTSTGFSVAAINTDSNWSSSNCTYRNLSYVAMKYT